MNTNNNHKTYLRLFSGRQEYFARQYKSGYAPTQGKFGESQLREHLGGDETYGVYVLNESSMCNFFCIDLDIPKSRLDEIDFKNSAVKFEYLKDILDTTRLALHEHMKIPSSATIVEDSGGRGYHIWVFSESSPVPGSDAIRFYEILGGLIEEPFEFFPKQATLNSDKGLGNLIKLPLGVHQKYGKRSYFLDYQDATVTSYMSADESLERLERVAPLSVDDLSQILASTELPSRSNRKAFHKQADSSVDRPYYVGGVSYLSAKCGAVRKLIDKARESKAYSHEEAFHFCNVMLSVNDNEAFIDETLKRSYGESYDPTIANGQLEKIRPLYPTSCQTLRRKEICPGYCTKSVERQNSDELLPDTNPLSVWLTRSNVVDVPQQNELIPLIRSTQNVQRAYWLLKQYHEHEDGLFFDPFDFEAFENDLQPNSELAILFLDFEAPIQFSGYLPVDLPKKLTTDNQLAMRRMAYGSIYDQILIQSVFNIISPVLEARMHEASYGYRWNTSDSRSNQIFRDWRLHYPNFRNSVLERIRINPNGFYVCCDIKGYYDHIVHEILISQLEQSFDDPRILEFLASVIDLWKAGTTPACGLPQGPAYARVLANFYLNQFDKMASNLADGYFRYVDDFYLVFDTEEAAEQGLQEIANHLFSLGLELSDDELKKAKIVSNSDETHISKALDKIQYGILEETKNLSHLDQVRIESFFEAVKRQNISIESHDDVAAINIALPSYLYSASHDITGSAAYKKVVFDLTSYLVSEGWFYPKNLKQFFYRLIQLIPNNDDALTQLFAKLHPTHKIYFLLSLVAIAREASELDELLESTLRLSLMDTNSFVYGIAIAISRSQKLDVAESDFEFAKKCIRDGSYFAITKWLASVNLFGLNSETRKLIRDSSLGQDNDLVRFYVLRSLNGRTVPSLLDDRFVSRVIEQSSGFSILMVADYFSTLRTTTRSFQAAVEQIVREPTRKQICTRRLKSTIYESQSDTRVSENEDLCALYDQITDQELQRELLRAVERFSKIEERAPDSFARTHVMVENYNDCMLFKNIGEDKDYQFVEIIPTETVAAYAHNDISDLIIRLEDLSSKEILSTSALEVDASRDELLIKYRDTNGLQGLDNKRFSIEDDESILSGLVLSSQIYKKAQYYRRRLGASPLIAMDNLLVDDSFSSIRFRTLGKSLSPRFVISGHIYSASESDIAAQVGQLLVDLFFSHEQLPMHQSSQTVGESSIVTFLNSLIANLSAKDPAKRYSLTRFEYLVSRLSSVASGSSAEITDLFLVERLKSALYRRNAAATTWRGICAATDDHIGDILDAVPNAILRKTKYSPGYFEQFLFRRRLHYLTKQLLDLQGNYSNFLADRNAKAPYLDMASAMLSLSIVATETFCAYRAIENKKPIPELIQLLETEELVIGSEQCNRRFERKEIAQVVAALSKLVTEREQFEPVRLSLSEIGVVLVLSAFPYEKSSVGNLTITRPEKMDAHRFVELLNICLYRLPSVEIQVCDLVEIVKEALRNGEDYILDVKLEDLNREIEFVCGGLFSILKLHRIRRRTGVLATHMWPPTIVCKKRIGRKRYARNEALSHLPLTNKFPSQQTKSSWDAHEKKIRTLVVPGDRLSKLIRVLKAGKFFGRKVSYLYSGRIMLLWDASLALIIAGLSFFLAFAAIQSNNDTLLSLNSVGNNILGPLLWIMVGKIILVDVRHWVPEFQDVIGFFKKG